MDKRPRKVNEYINDRQKTLPAYSADKVHGRCCDVATIKECYVIMLRHRNKKEYYVIMLRRRNIYSYLSSFTENYFVINRIISHEIYFLSIINIFY